MATASNTLGTLLNEHDVARITGLSVASVRRWRLLRQGPKYLKIGSAVRYRLVDISAWIESRPKGGGQPQSEPGTQTVGLVFGAQRSRCRLVCGAGGSRRRRGAFGSLVRLAHGCV